ncbi:MAG TPA: radical SAM protein [Candidatus Lokiarchaeia archaeon]|nr:radical SAM protein [Candidatus Lokiarchaeia archaeon]
MASITSDIPALLDVEPVPFDPFLRRWKQAAFSIKGSSTAKHTVLWRDPVNAARFREVYGNFNFSIYSAATCNGNCPFCVEKVRPASRGLSLVEVKKCIDDKSYFTALEKALDFVRPLDPSVSITGGEPSIDPRLSSIIEMIIQRGFRKSTITTNGSGLLKNNFVPMLAAGNFKHLNISRAHFNEARNQAIMQLQAPFSNDDLQAVIQTTKGTALRPRLSCVLLRGEIDNLDAITSYLEWAADMGVDNVVFRQLMKFDPARCTDPVITFSDQNRILLDPMLHQIYQAPENHHPSFEFTKQVVGYYYYIEIYRYMSTRSKSIDVVFENADLAFIDKDRTRRQNRPVIHEMIFHPNGSLNSAWLPGEGILAKLA